MCIEPNHVSTRLYRLNYQLRLELTMSCVSSALTHAQNFQNLTRLRFVNPHLGPYQAQYRVILKSDENLVRQGLAYDNVSLTCCERDEKRGT